MALPVSPEPSGKKPDEPRSAVLAVRVATIDDLVLALRINRHKGGEGRTWCRIIGDWYKSKLIGVVGVLGDEPATFILGNLKGRYFHIRHWSKSASLDSFTPSQFMFQNLKERMPDGVKNILMTVDERDHDTHHMLIDLKFKAMGVKKDWYSKDHDGYMFEYPMGRFDK